MPKTRSTRQASISFRFEVYPNSTFAKLLTFTREGKHYPDFPRFPDRFTLPLNAFWWSHALQEAGTDPDTVKMAANGCLNLLRRQLAILQHLFPAVHGCSNQSNALDWLEVDPCPGKTVAITFRFQPTPQSQKVTLFDWVRDQGKRI